MVYHGGFIVKKIYRIAQMLFIAVLMMADNPAAVFAQSAGGRRTEATFKLFSSGNYHFKANMYLNDQAQGTFETYMKDGRMATITTSQGMTSRIVNRDNKSYMIMDSARMVMVMPQQDQAQAGTVTEGLVFVRSGTADFRGKSLPYEEYSEPDGDKETIAQYFFDGTKLVGIRNLDGDTKFDIEILGIDQNIPGNIFDIPSGYQVTDMSGLGR